jgi:WD40 repeat protein
MRLVSELVWTPLISFSHDGKVLATKRGGDPISVWNVQDWSNLGSLKAKGVITNFKLSPGSRLLAMMSVDNKTVRSPIGIAVWESASGKTVLQIRQTEDTPLTEWSFSLDGRLIMLRLRSGGIKLWNIERA